MGTTTITTSEQQPTPPAYNPGDLYELPARPGLTNAVGDMATIETSHRVGPDTFVTVYAPVRVDEADLAPGEKRLQVHTFTVNAARLGQRISGPHTREQIQAWDAITRIIVDSRNPQALIDLMERSAPCPVWDWCTRRDAHTTHTGPVLELALPHGDAEPGPGLEVALFAEDGGRVVAAVNDGCSDDLDSTGLRGEAKRFREYADQLADLADQLAAIEAAGGAR